jgi:glycosyltransferase involved in cell wall biosynthesis
MKVLFVNKFFFLKGGSERAFFSERDYLMKHGIEVIDFSMKDSRNAYSAYAPFFVTHINYANCSGFLPTMKQAAKFIHSSEATRKIQKLVQQEEPDIAHLHNVYHQITPSIIPVLKRLGLKVIVTLHDGKLVCPGYLMLDGFTPCVACGGQSFWKPAIRNCQGSMSRGILLSLEAYWHKWFGSYDLVDLFLTPSAFLADLVKKRVPEKKVQVLRNGLSLDAYSNRSDDQDYALYLGRLSREKGIQTLLRAHGQLDNPLPLKVAGTGPLEAELRTHEDHVAFLGYRSGESLEKILANCSFVIVPSEWYENCPMVILEAMAMGKPVIGSRIGGIPELIEHGETGFLFETGNVNDLSNKMTLLSSDRDARKRMGIAARKKAEEDYSMDAHGRQLMRTYQTLLSS